jgi:hypothetical protein
LIVNVVACHCGAVVIRLSQQPSEVFECSCSICRKLGALWAYYSLDEVVFASGMGTTRTYTWNKHWIEFHTCATCGCTTHWVPTDRRERRRMGVNARLVDGLNRTNTSLKHFDGGENNCFWTRDEAR